MKLEQYLDDEWVFQDSELPYKAIEAGDVAVDLWHSGQVNDAEHKFLGVIQQYPNHIDAIHHYSMFLEATGREIDAYLACRAAVSIGLQAIPSEFSWESSRLDWGSIANRPFLRAYHKLGLYCLRQDRFGESELIFSRLLSVSPNDNLGVRYMLPKVWFKLGKPEMVVSLCQKYDDSAPEISYSLALALVIQKQEYKASKALKQAIKEMPLVRKELLKKRHTRPKGMREGYISHGGADQAYAYWEEYGECWSSSISAMELLLGGGN